MESVGPYEPTLLPSQKSRGGRSTEGEAPPKTKRAKIRSYEIFVGCLENHPRTWIYAVNNHGDRFLSPKDRVVLFPFQMAFFTPWRLFQWGLFLSTYIQVLGWSSTPQIGRMDTKEWMWPAGIYISPASPRRVAPREFMAYRLTLLGSLRRYPPSHSHRWRCDISELPKVGYSWWKNLRRTRFFHG